MGGGGGACSYVDVVTRTSPGLRPDAECYATRQRRCCGIVELDPLSCAEISRDRSREDEMMPA